MFTFFSIWSCSKMSGGEFKYGKSLFNVFIYNKQKIHFLPLHTAFFFLHVFELAFRSYGYKRIKLYMLEAQCNCSNANNSLREVGH